ncbi:hypothetical protein DERF_014766 [Dermatophagoides farinae]|uniref:Uncharacterized protein n=1 Tax=Dermatophagoides farinae TaxID=6954 RepID=A0A922HK31_DERFA|nr:hypothetical protein DERF_014766 [Dermatophagoides farinae]
MGTTGRFGGGGHGLTGPKHIWLNTFELYSTSLFIEKIVVVELIKFENYEW